MFLVTLKQMTFQITYNSYSCRNLSEENNILTLEAIVVYGSHLFKKHVGTVGTHLS